MQRKILHESGRSFTFTRDMRLTVPLHYHYEYELIRITSGYGREFVGDAAVEYAPGDMTLIGTNVPHLHLCDSMTGIPVERSRCDMIQFPPSLFPADMERIDEYAQIRELLTASARGIRFTDATAVEQACAMMEYIDTLYGTERIVCLLRILDILARSEGHRLISTLGYGNTTDMYAGDEPVNKVYAYLLNNFNNTITLEQIAAYVNLSPASLCRYFKQRTDKTIFRCLAEIRTEQACRLLAYSELPVFQIADRTGFRNMAHFNRTFKEINGATPTEYRRMVRQCTD